MQLQTCHKLRRRWFVQEDQNAVSSAKVVQIDRFQFFVRWSLQRSKEVCGTEL